MKAIAFSLFNGFFIGLSPSAVHDDCSSNELPHTETQEAVNCEIDSLVSFIDSCEMPPMAVEAATDTKTVYYHAYIEEVG